MRLALEVQRRVKEQQKRISCRKVPQHPFQLHVGAEGVEKLSAPRVTGQGGIGDEPLECGQIWTTGPGGQDEHPGLFRLEATEGPRAVCRYSTTRCPHHSRIDSLRGQTLCAVPSS